MDRTEEDLKLVGFFGVFKQSFKTIFSSKKIFAQITLAFILPLAISIIIQMEIKHRFFRRIGNNSNDTNDSSKATTIDQLYYVLFISGYFFFLTTFSLLSTAAVVFTTASIYTSREVVFRNVLKVIPNIWNRLCQTFTFIIIAQTTLGVMGFVALDFIRDHHLDFYLGIAGALVLIIILILYVDGYLYVIFVCQLASVVMVLENIHGFKALKKGKILANGKNKLGMGIAFVLYGIMLGLIYAYKWFVEHVDDISGLGLIWRVVIGILCLVLLMKLLLTIIVTQTVLYLVCKSYHGEAIDKLSLSTFLGAYMGETVVYPGPGEEIQHGRPRPPYEEV